MIRVFLPWPPSANAYWRVGNNRVYVSKKAKEYKAQVQGIFLVEKLRMIKGPVSMALVVTYPKDKRTATRDLDNCIKVLTDSVEGLAFENDNLIDVSLAVDYDNPINVNPFAVGKLEDTDSSSQSGGGGVILAARNHAGVCTILCLAAVRVRATKFFA